MNALGTESVRLQGIHTDQADQIHAKQEEMEQNWEQLRNKVGVVICRCSCILCCFSLSGFGRWGKESKGAVEGVGDDPLATAYMSGGGGSWGS